MSIIPGKTWPWQNSTSNMKRGAFIVIEGLDRAGKTTQVRRLCDKLYSLGYNIKEIKFPDRTSPIGKMIDSYLQDSIQIDDHAIHLLFAANRWEKSKWIQDNLSNGYTIVCDRYYHSGMVYSAAKNDQSLSLEWARTCDVGLPCPDIVFFLDLEPSEAEKRGGYGAEKYEKKEMQERVRGIFHSLLQLDTQDGRMQMIDAGTSEDVVESKIFNAVNGFLESKDGIEIKTQIGKLQPLP